MQFCVWILVSFYKECLSLAGPCSTTVFSPTNFLRGNHGHSFTADLPTMKREDTITCHLIGKSGAIRTDAKCIVLL